MLGLRLRLDPTYVAAGARLPDLGLVYMCMVVEEMA
jgi:hypothetical protein